MVELLESQLKGLQKGIDEAAHLIKKDKLAKKQKKVFVGLLLVAFIMGVFSFLITLFYPADENAAQIESSVETLSTLTDSAIPTPDHEVLKKTKVVDTDKETLKAVNASVGISGSKSTEIPDKPVMEDTVGRTVTSEPEKKVVTTNTDKKKQVKELAANSSIFEVVFTGDCWFKLMDGNQKTVFASLKREGDRISYSGVTPFKVVLGDASKVLLTFDGESVNLKSHTAKNGRAQLTLKKG